MPAPSTTLPAVAPTREVVATLAPPATAPAVAPARAIVATPAPPAAPSTVSREIQWQTITLPPPRDFLRRSDPAPGVPRNVAGGGRTEAAARSLIEADGYRNVTGLTQGSDGAWHGKALRGSTETGVFIDARGHVSVE